MALSVARWMAGLIPGTGLAFKGDRSGLLLTERHHMVMYITLNLVL